MALNFPYPASPGDTYTYGSVIYTYDGVKWIGNIPSVYGDSDVKALLAGGSVTGIAVSGGVSSEYFLGPLANGQTNLNIPNIDGNIELTVNGNVWTFDPNGSFNSSGVINFGSNEDKLGAPNNTGSTDLIRLWDFNGSNPSGFNYAIGVEPNHMWFTMDVDNDEGGFKFYSQNSELLKVGGSGILTINNQYSFVNTAGTTNQILALQPDNLLEWANATDLVMTISDTAPELTDHRLWFNSVDGRLYINYDNTWVDTNPTVLPEPDLNPEVETVTTGSIIFSDNTVQTTAYTGPTSTDRLVKGNIEVALTTQYTDSFINKTNDGNLFFGDDEQFVMLHNTGAIVTQSKFNSGAPVIVQGASSNNGSDAGDVLIFAGTSDGEYQGQIIIATYDSIIDLSDGYWAIGSQTNDTFISSSQDQLDVLITTRGQTWWFQHDGTIAFPDGTEQNTAWTGDIALVSDTAPNVTTEGSIWFNTLEGRGYVMYNGVWIDFSPQVVPEPDVNPIVDSIEFGDDTVQTTAYVPNYNPAFNLIRFPDGTVQSTAWRPEQIVVDGGDSSW